MAPEGAGGAGAGAGGGGEAGAAGGAAAGGAGGAAGQGGEGGAAQAGAGGGAGGGAGDQGSKGAGNGAGAGGAGAQGAGAAEQTWPDDWRTKVAGDRPEIAKRLERYATPKEVADALLSVQQRIGAGELRSVLPKNATPEQVATWRQENGIPEAPDKYELKLKSGQAVPDEDKPIINGLLKTLHGVNANSAVASQAVDWYYEEVTRRTNERVQKDADFAREAEDALRAEWGNEYVLNRNLITGLVDTAPAEVRDLIKGARLGNGDPLLSNPLSLKWLNSLAREINPPTALVPNSSNPAAAIETEIKQIEGWMAAPKGTPDHKKYWNDAKTQERYRALLDGQAKVKG